MSEPLPQRPMTSDAFIAWAMEQPEHLHYELEAGEVISMSPERLGHARVKFSVAVALRDAIRAAGLACEAFGDGMAVEIDGTTVREPDALVRCGPALPEDTVKLTDPVILVEVGSPSSASRDAVRKLDEYFRLASVRHYLLVDPSSRTVVHHARDAEGRIHTRILRGGEGALILDPPGLTLDAALFF